MSQELVLEAGVKIIFHAWGTQPMMDGKRLTGAFFESKQGRRAIQAKVVIDATGDGDLYSQAGCGFDSDINGSDTHHCTNTSWLFGGVDMPQWIEFKSQRPEEYSAFMAAGRAEVGSFEKPVVSWRNDIALFMGPRQAGFKATDVEDLTEVEIASRRFMMKHLDFFKKNAPGFEGAYLLMMAPQIGVRHSRRLHALKAVTRAQWDTGLVHEDEIAVCPSLSPVFPNISIPYAALVPREVEGLLAPGKHMSCDANSHSFLREIPECWLTGHGAGVAAALAVQLRVALRDVPVAQLQAVLREQGAIVRTAKIPQPVAQAA